MPRFLLRRLLHAIFILLGVSFLTFLLLNSSPGSYLDKLRGDPRIPADFIEQEVKRLGLDRPWIVSYGLWLKGIVTEANFGKSFEYKRPVLEVMAPAAWHTLLLSLTSIAFAWLLAIPLGVIAAYRQHKPIDVITSGIAIVGISIPEVFMALVAIYFAAVTGWFPTGGLADQVRWESMTTMQRMLDIAHHLVLPTLVLGLGTLAFYMRQMRGSVLDVLRADYIRTARAKGVSERKILFRHALRNALNPLITLFGFSLSSLLSGAVLVEMVFSYPGLGQLTVNALFKKDIYLVMADTMVATLLLIGGNLIADLLLAWSDPRIKLQSQAGE